MKYILLVHEKKEATEILKNIGDEFNIQYSDNYIDISLKTNSNSYVLIEYDPGLESEFEEEDILLFSKLKLPMYSFVKYSDLLFLKNVLEIIVKNVNCYIDNDHNTLLNGIDFMRKWEQNPSWDWTLD